MYRTLRRETLCLALMVSSACAGPVDSMRDGATRDTGLSGDVLMSDSPAGDARAPDESSPIDDRSEVPDEAPREASLDDEGPAPDAPIADDSATPLDASDRVDVVVMRDVASVDTARPDVVSVDTARIDVIAVDTARTDVVSVDTARTDVVSVDTARPDAAPDVVAPPADAGATDAGGGSTALPTLDFSGGSSAAVTIPSNVGSRTSVSLVATVNRAAPSITLTWMNVMGRTVSSIEVYRKTPGASSWGTAIAMPAASASSYTDTTVAVGTAYEYRVRMNTNMGVANGYLSSGIEVAPVEQRGKVLVLVEQALEAPLANELAQLRNDLASDGWIVRYAAVAGSASVTDVKTLIRTEYMADPTRLSTVYIVGHLAVPYSGNAAPDGHGDHTGAWPADGFYGDVDGTWTDTTVNTGNNRPGDGRFDPSDYPTAIELEVGRLDLLNMDSFWATGETSDLGLYRRYLQRAHAYRAGLTRPQQRAIVQDNFDYYNGSGGGYGFPGGAYRAFYGLVGASNVTVYAKRQDEAGFQKFFQLVGGQSYLFTYASGGGGYTQAAGIGTTWELAPVNPGGVFNMAFGSYFGDWNNNNNFLRAFVSGGAGLTSVWSGSTHWHFHRMSMGERIGTSHLLAMNNKRAPRYELVNGGCCSTTNVHMALMGDPTLRLYPIASPTNVTVVSSSGRARVAWTASTDAVGGYHVYEITAAGLTRLTTTPVTATNFTTSAPYTAGARYAVRAIAIVRSPTGTYVDLSVGGVGVAP